MQRPERFRKKLNKLQITKLPNSKMYQKRQTERGEGVLRAIPELQAGNLPNDSSVLFIFFRCADCNCWQTVCPCPPLVASPAYHFHLPSSARSHFRPWQKVQCTKIEFKQKENTKKVERNIESIRMQRQRQRETERVG